MRKKGKGQLLILVLAVMGIGMMTIAPLLAYVDLSLRLSTQAAVRNFAYYAAEAGVQMAIGELYQAKDPISGSPYKGTMNDYYFNCTATNGSGIPDEPTVSSAFFDPGVTMYMRPMIPKGCSCRGNSCTSMDCYSFVATKGKTVKINWAGYTSDASRQPSDFDKGTTEKLNTKIYLYDSSGSSVPIVTKTPTADEVLASNEARIVANTLLVPGENISGGVYTVKFENRATRSNTTDAYATSQFFSDDADEGWYTFNGSITQNCDHFVDDNGDVTIMVINEDNGDAVGGTFGYGRQLNTFSFFCDYVSVSITSNVTGTITTETYTYNGTEWGGKDGNISYAGIINVGSGSSLGMPGNTSYHSPAWYGGNYHNHDNTDYNASNVHERLNASALAISDGNYSQISAPDGDRMLATTDPRLVGMNNSCMWYNFRIPEMDLSANRDTISRIDVHWEGYQTKAATRTTWWGSEDNRDDDKLYLLLWNNLGTRFDPTDDTYHILACKEVDAGFTWVKIEQGSFSDYLITSNSSKDGETAVTITAYVRQSPGPSIWWEEQSLDILSWNVHIW